MKVLEINVVGTFLMMKYFDSIMDKGYIFNISSINAQGIVCLLIIGFTSFLTAIGLFDNLIRRFRSGLIIPTTGFAHSVTSSAIDFKKEGLINGIGSNIFHLAGSVILFSISASFFLVILKVIISA